MRRTTRSSKATVTSPGGEELKELRKRERVKRRERLRRKKQNENEPAENVARPLRRSARGQKRAAAAAEAGDSDKRSRGAGDKDASDAASAGSAAGRNSRSKSILQEASTMMSRSRGTDASSVVATPSKTDGELSSFMLSPIPKAGAAVNETTKTTPARALEKKMEACKVDPYEQEESRRDSGRFKPTKKKKQKEEVSPRTLKMIEDKGKQHFEQTKKFYEEVDAESLEDCFEII